MSNITVNDLNAITELTYSVIILGILFSFIIFFIIRHLILSIIYRINFPYRIKTEHEYLYRSKNGTYCSALRCREIEIERKRKKSAWWIKHHKYVLSRLENGESL